MSNHQFPTATSALSAADGSIVCLPIASAAVGACAAICYRAFVESNASVGQSSEYPSAQVARDGLGFSVSQPTRFHLMAVRPGGDSSSEHWVDGIGEVLGVVLMNCTDEAAFLGPLAVSPAEQSRGVGRALMERCIEAAKQRGMDSVRLIANLAVVAPFSLYHSLGFRTCEHVVAVHAHISAAHYEQLSDEMQAAQISVRPMERGDIPACNQLHVATNAFSRVANITASFEAQPSQLKDTPHTDGQQNGTASTITTAAPTVSCFVAVAAGGAIVGYCTGWTKMNH